MIKSDCHMHTCFSADSEAPVDFYAGCSSRKRAGRGLYHRSYGSGLSGRPRICRQMHFNLTWMSILAGLTV